MQLAYLSVVMGPGVEFVQGKGSQVVVISKTSSEQQSKNRERTV